MLGGRKDERRVEKDRKEKTHVAYDYSKGVPQRVRACGKLNSVVKARYIGYTDTVTMSNTDLPMERCIKRKKPLTSKLS